MEYNANQNNTILTAQSISKLVERIKDRQNNEPELKYLKEKCIACEDAVVSLAASKGLVMLVESDVLQVSATLSELVSSLSLAKSFAGITAAICNLLQIDLRYRINTNEKYKCPFNLRAPQHPLVSILKQQQDTWIDILSKITDFYENSSDRAIFYANESLYPFYMYVICNPASEVPELFQHKLWNYLIQIDKQQSIDVTTYVIMWLQISPKRQSARASSLLIDLMSVQRTINSNDIKEVLFLWLTSLVYELIRQEHDPRCVILRLQDAIKSYEYCLRNVVSSMLIILANCIIVCPSVYLCSLLELCKAILLLNLSNAFAVQTIRVSVLQWLSYGCTLITDSLQVVNDILLYIENNGKCVSSESKELYSNRMFYFLKSTNNHVHQAVELSILSESITAANISDWLNRADKLPTFLLKNMFNYFAALLLYEFDDTQITQKIIKVLLKIANTYKETTTQLLTLFLYKLSNSTNPKIHFNLLKALPKMAVLKENLPLILNTLELLKHGMLNLKSFVVMLFFDLWDTDGKCYPHLQNVLVTSFDKTESATQLWEYHVTKSYILKQICLKRPEVYGRELVGHLSEILNKCTGQNGALPSALAIDGIKALCNAGVIDISSTWNELAPRFSSETRITVITSLCSLMAEVSYFGPSECSDKLIEDIVTRLWQYVSNENIEVVSAAVNALQCFTLEQVSPYLPDDFKTAKLETDVSLPFGLIQGECWINLLLCSQSSAINIVGDLLIKYISIEISAYRSGTYKVDEGHREPQDFNYLPEHSIVRALGNYLRRQVQKWYNSTIKQVYLQCLRILSQQYSKPLPPTDWCFLQELVHVPEARSYCITLASHQVQLSGTARRLVENYITAMTHTTNVEDIETVYKNLKYLCNSIQPMTLQPFIQSSMAFSLQQKTLFEDLIIHLKSTLGDENLHEANRLNLSQVIVNIARQLDLDDSFFTKLLECIVILPIRYIDELSSPRLWKEESAQLLKLSVRVRCALAQKANVSPLTWLNDFIDAACFMESQHDYVLTNIAQVMETFRNSDIASAWILELLGHIQSTIANENKNNYHLQFLCDVFILSVVILAGQDIFVIALNDLVAIPDHRLRLFPQSIALLMKTQCWKQYVSQVSEWLFYMTNYHDTSENYKISFYQALAALRHEDAFAKQSKWMKYVGTTACLNI